MTHAESGPKIASITAGGAGMYCGSCMRDNTLAAALLRQGCRVELVPLYTPIRTDEPSVSNDEVFFGGINVFLQQKMPWLRFVPEALDHWLDRPGLLNALASGTVSTSAKQLGALTVSMLRGQHGRQRKEVHRLVTWLANKSRPQLINLSNVLIAGCVPAMKQALDVPVLVTLQGDDLFLEGLPPRHRKRALSEIRGLVKSIDGFLVFSQYYADFMSEYLAIPPEKIHLVPMGINVQGFDRRPSDPARDADDRPPTVGYLARICKEKGLHVLIDAMQMLRTMSGTENANLRIAGWLGADDKPFFEEQMQRLQKAGLASAVQYDGVVDRPQKLAFLQDIDVLSVPTVYRDPKGIFVLEALAAGVPVVQPEHGAFPELLASTGGGRLVRPEDPQHLAETLHELLTDSTARRALGEQGRASVHRSFTADAMAAATLAVYQKYLT
jgi:glycosyltransferase involved in cell wall biosynthesis